MLAYENPVQSQKANVDLDGPFKKLNIYTISVRRIPKVQL